MKQTLIDTPRLRVERRTGTYGPRHVPYGSRHDPYSYEEMIAQTPTDTVVLHQGLGRTLKINGVEVEPPAWLDLVAAGDWQLSDKLHCAWYRETWRERVGYSLEQIERWHRKLRSRCSRCGCRDTREAAGFPGETFDVCAECGHVVDSRFCESAVE